jgi:hypothetical protein
VARSRALLLVAGLAVALALGLTAWLSRRAELAAAAESRHPVARAEVGAAAVLDAPAAALPGPEPAAEAPLAAAAPESASPPAPAAAAELPAEDPIQCLVFGRVTDGSGEPIRVWEPWVSLRNSRGERCNAKPDETGHYSLAGLAPGRWSLACSGVGWREVVEELELSLTEPILRRDFRLAPSARVAVEVVAPDGRPFWKAVEESGGSVQMPELLPVATSEPPGESIPEADGLHNDHVGVGNFWDYGPPREGLGPTYIGVVMLDGDPPVWVSLLSGVHVLETKRVEPGQSAVTYVLDPETVASTRATLVLRALDAATRAPLSGLVEVRGTTGPGPSGALDADGAGRLSLDPGEYDVRVHAEGHEHLPRHVRLAAGQVLDLGELALETEVTIEGRVLDGEGRPLHAQELLVLWRDPGLGRLVEVTTAVTDEDGRLDVRGLRADDYRLRSYGDDERSYPGRNEPPTAWVSGFVDVSTRNGSVRGLEIRLVQAAVLVLNGGESLASGSFFRLLDAHGAALRASHVYAGFAAKAKVPPGSYTLLLLDADGAELSRRSLELHEGLTELDLRR